jgi:integrase
MRTNHTPGFLDAQRAVPNADGSPLVLRFGDGLDLWVTPRQKMWRCKVQRDGKRTTLNLGSFPEVSIKEAKAKRAAIKVAPDPARAKRTERVEAVEAAERTLRFVASRWMEARGDKANWTPLVREAIGRRLETYVLPKLGDVAISAIDADDVEGLIKSVFRKYPRTAVALRQHLSGMFAYAARRDWCATNLVAKIAEDLPARKRGTERTHAHVATIEDARAVLSAVEARAKFSAPWTILAHRLIALTAVRSGEARGARWSEFDLDAATWTIPAERMKGKDGSRRAHVVALAPQAIEVVRAAAKLRKNEFVFPSQRRGSEVLDRSSLTRCVREALTKANLGRVLVTHGWRATFSTIMNELDEGASFRVVDVMLAHSAFRDSVETRDARKSSVEGHYNHAQYRSARHRIACQWADMLLDGAPTALALIGLDGTASNVVRLVPQARRTAA